MKDTDPATETDRKLAAAQSELFNVRLRRQSAVDLDEDTSFESLIESKDENLQAETQRVHSRKLVVGNSADSGAENRFTEAIKCTFQGRHPTIWKLILRERKKQCSNGILDT